MLTNNLSQNDDTTSLPPLSSLITLLEYRTPDEDAPPGLFELRRDHEAGTDVTDYSALSFHVDVLSAAMKNISVYAENEKEEKRAVEGGLSDSGSSSCSSAGASPPGTPSRKDRPKTHLEIIDQYLKRLSGSIGKSFCHFK